MELLIQKHVLHRKTSMGLTTHGASGLKRILNLEIGAKAPLSQQVKVQGCI